MKALEDLSSGVARAKAGTSAGCRKTRLLAATCLTMVVWSGHAMPQEPAVELGTVTIEGQPDSPIGPDDGYVARNTTTGSKTDTPLNEIPQSVSVVTRKQMDDRQPAQLEDALSYIAGVTAAPWGLKGTLSATF